MLSGTEYRVHSDDVLSLDGLHAELAEIDENLVRSEMTWQDRSLQMARRKEVYEALYPETRVGGDRMSAEAREAREARASGLAAPLVPFVQDTAAKIGVHPRTVAREVQIAKSISAPVQEVIRDTPLANRKVDLIKLSRLQPTQQEAVVEVIQANPKLNVDQGRTERLIR